MHCLKYSELILLLLIRNSVIHINVSRRVRAQSSMDSHYYTQSNYNSVHIINESNIYDFTFYVYHIFHFSGFKILMIFSWVFPTWYFLHSLTHMYIQAYIYFYGFYENRMRLSIVISCMFSQKRLDFTCRFSALAAEWGFDVFWRIVCRYIPGPS